MSADGDAVFTAGGAAGKKRRKKKILVVEDDEAAVGIEQQQEQPPQQPQQQQAPPPMADYPAALATATRPPAVQASIPAPAPVATAPREPDTPPRADSDDDDDFNPLAEAMGLSAASVAASARADDDLLAPTAAARSAARAEVAPTAAHSGLAGSAQSSSRSKPKSTLATSFSSGGGGGGFRDDAEGGISSFAKPGSTRSAQSVPASAQAAPAAAASADKDEFDFDDDFDVLGSISTAPSASGPSSASAPSGRVGAARGGVTATSSGYIDDKDMATIQAARAAALRGKNSQQQQQQAEDDEFDNLDDVSADLRVVDHLSLAAQQKKHNQFDEFNDVWEDTESALKNPAAPPGPTRKVLKASKEQRKVEKPNAKEEARMAAEAARAAAAEEAAARERQQQQGLQNPLLAKLGMGPTTILSQYDRPAGSGAAAAPAVSGGKKMSKAQNEQMKLESNDEVLAAAAAAASPVAPTPSNVVEALVSAHTAPSGLDDSQPEIAAELQQWGAVNEVREKQLAAAAAEAERVAKQGKSIGIRAADDVSRDTPLHYDGALKSLTVGPSAASAAASAAIAAAAAESDPSAAASSSPLPSTAVQLQLLKRRIQVHDFRNIGFARAARYKLMGPPRLASRRLEEERDLVFCMAQMQVDYVHCIDHERMLLTLYRGLTGDALAPPQFGNHWQVIGFQGSDPATDLRGAGLFSLIQLLYFHKHHRALMLRIYQLSLDERQNFPFATLSTNLTAMVLQALRECYKLYGEINRRGSVFLVVNQLYVAAFYEMFLQWKSQNLCIVDWNDTRATIEQMVLHCPKAIIKKFNDNQGAGAGEGGGPPEALEFTEIP